VAGEMQSPIFGARTKAYGLPLHLMPRVVYGHPARGIRFPIIDIVQQLPRFPRPASGPCFLRNHDEMKLEMVTERTVTHVRLLAR